MKIKTEFSKEDIKAFEPENKVGLIATVSPEGLPHITLISTILAKDAGQITWGQFSEGNSKTNVKNNPKTGFLIMTMDRQIWRGKANWQGSLKEGEDYEKFNKLSMWRYNTYMGIHTVHFMDLVETTVKKTLPLVKIILSLLLTKMVKKRASNSNKKVMNYWTKTLFNRMDTLKFLSFIGKDGFPVIIPLLQCQAADSTRLVFITVAYKDELSSLETGSDIAIFGMTLQMEDVLVRGKFSGFKKYNGIKLGAVDINWVYNSMPPKAGRIYPEVKIEKVVNF